MINRSKALMEKGDNRQYQRGISVERWKLLRRMKKMLQMKNTVMTTLRKPSNPGFYAL